MAFILEYRGVFRTLIGWKQIIATLKARSRALSGALAFALGAAAAPPAAATSDFLADVLTERGSSGTGMVSRFEQSPYRGGGGPNDSPPLYLSVRGHLPLHSHPP